MKELLRVSEVAPLLGVKRGRVYRLIREGVLPHVQVAGAIKIPRAAFEQWLREKEQQALQAVKR